MKWNEGDGVENYVIIITTPTYLGDENYSFEGN